MFIAALQAKARSSDRLGCQAATFRVTWWDIAWDIPIVLAGSTCRRRWPLRLDLSGVMDNDDGEDRG
jgi:hypothetical protein